MNTVAESDNIIITENKYRQKIALNCTDHIGQMILRDGLYDRIGLYFIEKILAKLQDPIVFDIGANIGNHALVMSQHSQRVYLFEPQTSIVNLLRQTMHLNHITNWQIFEFGLSDEEQTLPLYKNREGNNGASTFTPSLKSEHFAIENSPVYNGDDIIDQHHINRIDFIKLDVEGFEAKVIAGLKRSIKKHLPIIIMEWNNAVTKKQFYDHQLFHEIFSNYIIKSVIHSHHKSRWHSKWLGKLRRFVYKLFKKKYWLIGEFIETFDYQHVLFIPKEKESVLKFL